MQMPILNPQFFQDHAPNLEFFQKWKNLREWNAQILPIYEWQGILYIAVSEEPVPSSLSAPHVFVQADAQSLQNLWNSWAQAEAPDETEIISLDSHEVEIIPTLEDQTVVSPTKPEELLELSDEPKAPIEEPMEATSVGIESENMDAPSGFFATETEDATQISDKTYTKIMNNDPIIISLENLENPQVPIGLSVSAANEEEPSAVPSGLAMKLKPTKVPPPPSRPGMSEDTPAPTNKKINGENEVSDVLDKLSAHFHQSMILLVNGQVAKPWKWSEGFAVPAKIASIDIGLPSPFRVVYRTSKSFYGAVKPNPITDQLAQAWLKGAKPTELSITPILVDDQLVGLILCNGNTRPDSLDPLRILENAGTEIGKRFAKNRPAMQAA